jgi:hypoxanthine phosphoribosyltransferase
VASSVCANKRWIFVSSTLLRQTIRNELLIDELSEQKVYIIDGIVSTRRSTERHDMLVRDIMRMQATKVVEHPDIFVKQSPFTLDDFDYIIELRNHPDEVITYDLLENPGFESF